MQTWTADWCVGRWTWLLPTLGLPEEHLKNKHGPCPLCGGKDRFRFDDKEGRGTWFCNACGAGDGFDLISKYLGLGFQETVAKINKLRGGAPEPDQFKPVMSTVYKRTLLNEAWRESKDSWLVDEYLKNRGLTQTDDIVDLRGNKRLHIKTGTGHGYLPAMVGLIRNPKGEPVSIHRTYLLPNGSRQKKIMSPTEPIAGGAVKLSPMRDNGILVVGEGIETALAGREAMPKNEKQVGVWAALSANLMKALVLPQGLARLVICVDNDRSFTGQASAFELARKTKVQTHKNADVWLLMPDTQGCDMVDVMNRKCGLTWITG